MSVVFQILLRSLLAHLSRDPSSSCSQCSFNCFHQAKCLKSLEFTIVRGFFLLNVAGNAV